MIKHYALAFMLLAAGAAGAQPAPQAPPPDLQALGQMLGEAVQREAQATARAIAAERQVRALQAELDRVAPKPDVVPTK